MSDDLAPLRIEIADSDLDDLRNRLDRTRWPEPETVSDWSQGIPLSYVQELCDYWAKDYDWRRVEAQLNELPQFKTEIDGLAIHFLHVRSPHEEATPLILTHGWPGSVVEFLKVVGPLTDPTAHGGDASDAFHVVCPSLPGYGFSNKPTDPGWNVERTARAWATLMSRLGYERYGAQGGDWGGLVTASLAQQEAGNLLGVHLNFAFANPESLMAFGELTDEEQADLGGLAAYQENDNGYAVEQSTKPQTIGYGLVDSPAAQCAWIVEKFMVWSDCDGHPENSFTRDELLDNVMLYWLTGSGASSARLYWESFKAAFANFDPVQTPTAYSVFPKEILRLSKRWAETRFTDLRYYNRPGSGGHFAAFEVPDVFVDEVRSGFRAIR